MNCRVDDLKRREQETFRLDPKHLSESEHWRRSAHPGYDSWAKDKERKRARSLQSRARSEPAVNGSKRRAGEDLTSSSTKRQRPDEVTESKPENNTTRASDNVSRVMGDAAKAAWQRRWRQLEMDKKAQEAFRHAAEQKILAMNRKAQEALQRKLAADQEATEAWENKKKAEKDLERANEQHHAAIEKRERAADDEVEALQEKINAEEEEVQARNKSSAIFHQLVALMRDSRDPGGGWF
ncbi:hypothetical protein QBC41DRAFT_68273 [Cercophora samala]|uniref:Uncharacterized protein n=1 Tax=Cercophora samala TaxID=330535 RepID=A0AA39ZHH9_9PEZI|nr:hypothetical protein QBC41DRAFT_68273 [Cercophora samala]